jgi:hypothetical protein
MYDSARLKMVSTTVELLIVAMPEIMAPLVSATLLFVLLSRKSKRAYEMVDNEQSLSPQLWVRRQNIRNGNKRANIFFIL